MSFGLKSMCILFGLLLLSGVGCMNSPMQPSKALLDKIKKLNPQDDDLSQSRGVQDGDKKSSFSPQDINSGDFVLLKACSREVLFGKTSNEVIKCVSEMRKCLRDGKSKCDPKLTPIPFNDRAESLIGSDDIIRNLRLMESLELEKAQLPESPWSDDYWPIYRGGIGSRYSDPEAPAAATFNWEAFYSYFKSKPTQELIETKVCGDNLDHLSPAEKYDLLVGKKPGEPGSLTQSVWQEGENYFKQFGHVEYWMGICHGWAPASFKVPRPVNTVDVISLDGKHKIRFYAHDIRALASYLWSRSTGWTRFVGGRCNVKNPQRDSTGRVIDKNCNDTNPATWHLSVVNMIGVRKQSFVMDATFDYEVWNEPVYSYSYGFKHPLTKKPTSFLNNALLPISKYEKDPFNAYRNKDTKYVVGVEMKVTHIADIGAEHVVSEDRTKTLSYEYELELDTNLNIIGGHWISKEHPDFLWTPVLDQARTVEDWIIKSQWALNKPIPSDWKLAAQTALNSGKVLGRIIEELASASRE